jgi:hypothetical protein
VPNWKLERQYAAAGRDSLLIVAPFRSAALSFQLARLDDVRRRFVCTAQSRPCSISAAGAIDSEMSEDKGHPMSR